VKKTTLFGVFIFLGFLVYNYLPIENSKKDEAGFKPWKIPVVVIKYFPLKGNKIDINITGDWGASLSRTRAKVDGINLGLISALEDGSRYHYYKNKNSPASLDYEIVKEFEFLEPLPTFEQIGKKLPMIDYNTITERINIKNLVEIQGIKEIWIWGYHGGKVDLWESNMSGPFGDISNSDRIITDLPILSKTYTVYNYNYQRNVSEAVENHMHQLEAVLNYIDGRDETAFDEWFNLLYWGKFVGSDKSHKIINPGAGWSHYPPNADKDYDWANNNFILTDIEDWKPDGSGKKKRINSERWNKSSLKWFIYLMQNHPGYNNNLTFDNKIINNWWYFIGDFDNAMKNKIKLASVR
tara:strand:- start:74 stop:1132 length:1059 start_codon:yes stop_codon:yes gene_type:complete